MIEQSTNLLDKFVLSKDVPAELHHPLHPLNNPLLHSSLPKMTIYLQSQHIKTIRDHAEKTYPNECCGLLIGKQTGIDQIIAEIWPAENVWSEETAGLFADNFDYAPEHRYTIAPELLLKAQRETRERDLIITGIYHSHPNHPAIPSECDRQYAWPEYSYIIVSVEQGKSQDLLCWKLDDTHQFQSETIEILKPAHNPASM